MIDHTLTLLHHEVPVIVVHGDGPSRVVGPGVGIKLADTVGARRIDHRQAQERLLLQAQLSTDVKVLDILVVFVGHIHDIEAVQTVPVKPGC